MAEPYKSTPASRVFGMGLPRRKVSNPGTIFGIEVDEPRWSLDPRLRRDMAQEQQMAIQEAALANEQRKQEMELQGQEAMSRAFEELSQGEDIENIFRRNPAIAFSPQFGQFSQAAQFMQPSRASKTLAPSLAKDLPGQYRSKYFELLNTPQYANDPLGAKTVIDTEMGIDEQRGRLAKVGIPLTGERKLLSPEEEEGLIFQHTAKKSDPQIAAMEKYLERLQKKRDSLEAAGKDQIPNPLASDKDPTIPKYIPSPEYEKLEKEITDVDAQYGARMRGIFMPKAAATAEDITSPAATGGAPKSFKETMKEKAVTPASQLPTIPKVDDKEILADLNNPEADENTFEAAINDPNTSMEVKKVALEKLKKFAEKPRKISGLSLSKAEERKTKLNKMVQDAEKQLRLAPEMEKYRKVWSEKKSQMADWINEFADDMGVDTDELEISLAINEPVEKGGIYDRQEQQFTYRDKFAQFLKKKFEEDVLSKKVKKLEPFSKGEFAKELGLTKDLFSRFSPLGMLGIAAQKADILPSGAKTYEDVLDAYLREKFPEQTSQPSVTTPQEIIVDVTTREEVEALPKGTKFKGPDGKIRIK